MAARLSKLYSSVSENGHFLSHSLSQSLCPQAWTTPPFTHPRKSRAMAGNWKGRGRGNAGLVGHMTHGTPEWLRGEEALRNLELAFGTSLHGSRWR